MEQLRELCRTRVDGLVESSDRTGPEEQNRASSLAIAMERKVAIITGGGEFDLLFRKTFKR